MPYRFRLPGFIGRAFVGLLPATSSILDVAGVLLGWLLTLGLLLNRLIGEALVQLLSLDPERIRQLDPKSALLPFGAMVLVAIVRSAKAEAESAYKQGLEAHTDEVLARMREMRIENADGTVALDLAEAFVRLGGIFGGGNVRDGSHIARLMLEVTGYQQRQACIMGEAWICHAASLGVVEPKNFHDANGGQFTAYTYTTTGSQLYARLLRGRGMQEYHSDQ